VYGNEIYVPSHADKELRAYLIDNVFNT
jgi:hypothetical protein